LHMAQLMPLPLTVSCFSEIQISFTFRVPAHPGSPGKRAVKRVCVCVAVPLKYAMQQQWRSYQSSGANLSGLSITRYGTVSEPPGFILCSSTSLSRFTPCVRFSSTLTYLHQRHSTLAFPMHGRKHPLENTGVPPWPRLGSRRGRDGVFNGPNVHYIMFTVA